MYTWICVVSILISKIYSQIQDLQACPVNPIVLTAGRDLRTFDSPHEPYVDNPTYLPDLDCSFLLITQDISAVIQIMVQYSELEEPVFGECNDYVVAYDGAHRKSRPIVKWCGRVYPATVISTGSSLFVHFHTDSVVQKRGFSISYSILPSGDCPYEWANVGNDCYKTFSLPYLKTFTEAQDSCVYANANLASFDRKERIIEVTNQIDIYNDTWVGYFDAPQEDDFQTVDRTSVFEGFPRLVNNTDSKDCVILKNNDVNIVLDINDCYDRHDFMCKKSKMGETVVMEAPVAQVIAGRTVQRQFYTIWLLIVVIIIFLFMIMCIAYSQFRKRYNRIDVANQNQLITSTADKSGAHHTSGANKSNPSSSAGSKKSKNKTKNKIGLADVAGATMKVHERDKQIRNSISQDSARIDMTPNQPMSSDDDEGHHRNIVVNAATPPAGENEKVEVTVTEPNSLAPNIKGLSPLQLNRGDTVDSEDRADDDVDEPEVQSDASIHGEDDTPSVSIISTQDIVQAVTVVEKVDQETETDAAVGGHSATQSTDYDTIEMVPMNPHTQKKRRSHMHIFNNVDAKTTDEFWEVP